MISLVNFGESPFYILFVLVLSISCLVIVVNVIALAVSALIDSKTKKIISRTAVK